MSLYIIVEEGLIKVVGRKKLGGVNDTRRVELYAGKPLMKVVVKTWLLYKARR